MAHKSHHSSHHSRHRSSHHRHRHRSHASSTTTVYRPPDPLRIHPFRGYSSVNVNNGIKGTKKETPPLWFRGFTFLLALVILFPLASSLVWPCTRENGQPAISQNLKAVEREVREEVDCFFEDLQKGDLESARDHQVFLSAPLPFESYGTYRIEEILPTSRPAALVLVDGVLWEFEFVRENGFWMIIDATPLSGAGQKGEEHGTDGADN